jgi:hypothetical protein
MVRNGRSSLGLASPAGSWREDLRQTAGPKASQVSGPDGRPRGLQPAGSLPASLPVGCLFGVKPRCDDIRVQRSAGGHHLPTASS